ncbi:hypothetical protein ABTL77_20630, partial [Acinetobacter baumannii]
MLKTEMKYFFLFFSLFYFSSSIAQQKSPFLVNPYLQVGYTPKENALQLLWQTDDEDADWSVEYTNASNKTV